MHRPICRDRPTVLLIVLLAGVLLGPQPRALRPQSVTLKR